MMEPTVTQNGALYYAHHKTSKERTAFFRRFRLGAKKESVARKQPTIGELFLWPRLQGHAKR
jgi:hypothetical protein